MCIIGPNTARHWRPPAEFSNPARRKSRGWGALARTVLQTKYIGGEVRVTRSKVRQLFGYRARAPTLLGGAGRAVRVCRPAAGHGLPLQLAHGLSLSVRGALRSQITGSLIAN